MQVDVFIYSPLQKYWNGKGIAFVFAVYNEEVWDQTIDQTKDKKLMFFYLKPFTPRYIK